jgi:hypothetical protein
VRRRPTPGARPPARRRGNQLRGTVPEAWGALGDTLVSLRLRRNPGLTGCLPRGLAKLRRGVATFDGTGLEAKSC